MFLSYMTILDKLAERLTGPMHFRFIFQPFVAILLGIRDGRQDAKVGNPPFLLNFFYSPYNREQQIQSAIKTLIKPVLFGIILDSLAQYMIFKQINPGGAFTVGTFVLALPYSLAREIANRIVRKNLLKKNETDLPQSGNEN